MTGAVLVCVVWGALIVATVATWSRLRAAERRQEKAQRAVASGPWTCVCCGCRWLPTADRCHVCGRVNPQRLDVDAWLDYPTTKGTS